MNTFGLHINGTVPDVTFAETACLPEGIFDLTVEEISHIQPLLAKFGTLSQEPVTGTRNLKMGHLMDKMVKVLRADALLAGRTIQTY